MNNKEVKHLEQPLQGERDGFPRDDVAYCSFNDFTWESSFRELKVNTVIFSLPNIAVYILNMTAFLAF